MCGVRKYLLAIIMMMCLVSTLALIVRVEQATAQQAGQAPGLPSGLSGQGSPGSGGPKISGQGEGGLLPPPTTGSQAASPSRERDGGKPVPQPAQGLTPSVPGDKPVPQEAEKTQAEPGPPSVSPVKSPIEQAFLEVKVSPGVSRELKQFGYGLFGGPASTFAPVDNVPVGPEYVIGPGDVIQVYMWGMVDNTFTLPVDRGGTIFLPKVGTLPVWGMSFDRVEELIGRQLSKYFSGFKLSLTMSQLRSVRVFVVGEVVRPGVYTVSSLSTVLNALFAAGGPTKLGSLRTIKLLRNNHLVGTLDLYDFLLKGDRAHDFRLGTGDTIFVPPIGQVVGIAGDVKRPAIYELKESVTLSDLVEMAGGFTVLGYLQRIQVERIQDRQRKVVMDLEFKDPSAYQEAAGDVWLQEGDLVQVFQVDPFRYRFVSIEGNVRRPGDYELKPGMTLKGLIARAEGILEGTYLERAEVARFRDDRTREILPVDIRKLLDGDGDLPLQQWDRVTIYHQRDVVPPRFVTIVGEVYEPGQHELTPGMKLSDLLFRANGLKKEAYLEKAELLRFTPGRDVEKIDVNIRQVLRGDSKADLPLQDEDHLIVHNLFETKYKAFASILGEVNKPGTYRIIEGMRVKDLIFHAGGLKETAYLSSAELTRITFDKEGTKTMVLPVDLESVLNGDEGGNPPLRRFDTLMVRAVPGFRKQMVEIRGEVKLPGQYIIKDGEPLSSVLKRAGGFTEEAYPKGAIFIRERVKKRQQEELDRFVKAREEALLQESARQAAGSLELATGSKEEAALQQQTLQQRRELLELLKSKVILGRVVVKLDTIERFEGSPSDLALEDGDTLMIPKQPSSVLVIGSVRNPTAVVYEKSKDIDYYLNRAGGLTKEADEDELHIVKADGSAVSSFQKIRELEPGDIVVAPPKVEAKVRTLPTLKDVATILGQFALTAGVLVALL